MADLEMYRGDSAVFRGTVTQVDEQEVVDLTGGKIYFTAKYSASDVDVNALIAIDSAGAYIDIDDPTTGVYLINLKPGHTTGVTLVSGRASLVYDVQFKDSASDVYTIDTGTLTILQDITQRVT